MKLVKLLAGLLLECAGGVFGDALIVDLGDVRFAVFLQGFGTNHQGGHFLVVGSLLLLMQAFGLGHAQRGATGGALLGRIQAIGGRVAWVGAGGGSAAGALFCRGARLLGRGGAGNGCTGPPAWAAAAACVAAWSWASASV